MIDELDYTLDDGLPEYISAFDKQIAGNHYKNMAIQPVEFIMVNNLGFCEGNAIKYICRHKNKGGVEDLEKAKHYIEMLIEQENNNKNTSA